jgi:ABC-type nitrate/sulfonate/bicarbonate transport system permease component
MAHSIESRPAPAAEMIRSFFSRFSRIYSMIGLLIFWEVLAIVINDPLFLPRLSDVLRTSWEHLRSGELVGDIAISTFRCVSGFALAFTIGVPLGILMGWSARWDNFWNFLISFSNPIPKLGLIPLFILWLGIGEASKVGVIAAGALFPIVINTYSGVRGVGKFWLWRAATCGANQLEILYKVILPAALPNIMAGARLGMAVSWILVLGAEMVAAQMGLGFRILYGQQTFDTRLVFAGLLMIAIIGFIFDRIILALSSVLCRWHFRQMDEFSAS